MATIITKNSQTANAVPSAASLEVGELAVNTADGKLYTEHTGGVVKEITPTTAINATKITNAGGFSITPSGTNLIFSYNGTNIAKLDSSGNFVTLANVTGYGTI